jgi:hypothetical protein
LSERLGYKSLSDLYHISRDNILNFGGRGLLHNLFNGSIAAAIQTTYPHHKWLVWEFEDRLPNGYWEEMSNQRDFLDSLGKRLGFQQMEEWYKVTQRDIDAKGCGLIRRYGDSPAKLLQAVYPEYPWVSHRFNSKSSVPSVH